MAKRYVDLDVLENLPSYTFSDPNTFFSSLETVDAEDIVKDLSAFNLRKAVEQNSDMVALQIWQRSDIKAVLTHLGIPASSEVIDELIPQAKAYLEDCTHNWEVLLNLVKKWKQEKEAE